METDSDNRAKSEGRSWWLLFVEGAGLVAIPSVVLYGLGLVVFWLRITLEYSRISAGTTWYAASLVPRSTAAASGVEAICRGIAFGAFVGAVLLLLLHLWLFLHSLGSDRERVKFFRSAFVTPFLALLSVATVTFILIVSFVDGRSVGFALVAVIVIIAYITILSVLKNRIAPNGFRGAIRHILGQYPKTRFRLIITITLLAVPTSAVLLPQQPALSCLWKADPRGEVYEANIVGTQNDTDPQQWTLQGGLLSKSDGAWYVLTESDRLEVIPDNDAIRVVGGDFSVRYSEIGPDGRPTGAKVSESKMEPYVSYAAVKFCSTFPSQPTITDLGNMTIEERATWYRVGPLEETTQEDVQETTQLD